MHRRPQVNEMALSVETNMGAAYRLDESLMERMMFPSTVGIRPIASSRLNVQRRMDPEIASIMRATLYPYLEVSYFSNLHGYILTFLNLRTTNPHSIIAQFRRW